MFAYCNNNAVNASDSLGSKPVSILEREGDKKIPVPPKRTSQKNKQNNKPGKKNANKQPKNTKKNTTNNKKSNTQKQDKNLWNYYDEWYQKQVENQQINAQLELQGAITIGQKTVEWFSTPGNVSKVMDTGSTVCAGVGVYLGLVGASIIAPPLGLSVAAAQAMAAGFGACAFILDTTAKVIN